MKSIMIVDDAEINREILKIIFQEQYNVIEAGDGEEAIEKLEQYKDEVVVMFLDLVMPKKNGLEVMEYMSGKGYMEFIPVIMITGEATTESDVKAYEYGAADIIYKPFESRVVMRRAMNLIELYESRHSIETKLEEKTRELKESQRKLAKNNEFLVNALGSIVEFRSSESGEHIQRVKGFTKIILKHLKVFYPEYEITNEMIDLISTASALHDVGKIAIPDDILNAPRRLTKFEFEKMKKHTLYGCDILEKFKQDDSEFYKYCYEICRWHHEKYDGNGYPDGLVGEEIPIWAQVVSVVDCYDALVSARVYKQPYAAYDAVQMIENGECGVFSEKIMKCFDAAKPELMRSTEIGFTFLNDK